MKQFDKYWKKSLNKKAFNRFFNKRKTIKHYCKLAYMAGMRHRFKKANQNDEFFRKQRAEFYEKDKKDSESLRWEFDCFQTALTETFTEKQVKKFFDNHDKIMAGIQNETDTG